MLVSSTQKRKEEKRLLPDLIPVCFFKELGLGKFLKAYYLYVVIAGLSQVLLLRENLRGFSWPTKTGLLTQFKCPCSTDGWNLRCASVSAILRLMNQNIYCPKSLLHVMIFVILSFLYNCCTRHCLGWVTSVILNMSMVKELETHNVAVIVFYSGKTAWITTVAQ